MNMLDKQHRSIWKKKKKSLYCRHVHVSSWNLHLSVKRQQLFFSLRQIMIITKRVTW